MERVGGNPDVCLRPLDAVTPFLDSGSSKECGIPQALMTGRPQIFADVDLTQVTIRPFEPQTGGRQRFDAYDLEFHRRVILVK